MAMSADSDDKVKRLEEVITCLEEEVKKLKVENQVLNKKVDSLSQLYCKCHQQQSVVDEVTEAADKVVNEQFLSSMAYEETSGLYYDFKSGFYYDAQRSLFYDGDRGIYYTYNYESSEYEVHSTTKALKRKPSLGDDTGASDKKESRVCGSSPASPGDLEEGEIVATDSEATAEFVSPCIRLVVVSDEGRDLSEKVGTLFIVTCVGGTIGREGDHEVILGDEPGCSRHHASITYESGKYFLKDSGSRNGTYLNKKKVKSAAEVGHGSRVQIGNTVLACHLHPGRETCNECEPGLLQKDLASVKNYVSPHDREKMRKKELKRLRTKFGVKGVDVPSSADYHDRSEERRRQQGSDNPFEKTQTTSADVAIDSQNKGYEMLSKMGWKSGQGLGTEGNEGRLEPVEVLSNNDRAGLGCDSSSLVVDKKTLEKAEMWKKTQKRFDGLDKQQPHPSSDVTPTVEMNSSSRPRPTENVS